MRGNETNQEETGINLLHTIEPGPLVGETLAVGWQKGIAVNGGACTLKGCLRDIKIWDFDGNLLRHFDTEMDYFISTVSLDPSETRIGIAGSRIGGAQWAVEMRDVSGTLLWEEVGPDFAGGAEVIFSPQGNMTAGLGTLFDRSGKIILWNRNGERIREFSIPPEASAAEGGRILPPRGLRFSDDGGFLFFISGRSVISQLDIVDGKTVPVLDLNEFAGERGFIEAYDISPSGDIATVIAESVASGEGVLGDEFRHTVLLSREGQRVILRKVFSGLSNRIASVHFLADGDIVTGGTVRSEEETDGLTRYMFQFEITEYTKGRPDSRMVAEGSGILTDLTVFPDGRIAAVTGDSIRIWNSRETLTAVITAGVTDIGFLDSSPDGQSFLAGPYPARIFSMDGIEKETIQLDGPCYSLGFTPRGEILQVYHRGFRLLDTPDGNVIRETEYPGETRYTFLARHRGDTVFFPLTASEAVLWDISGDVKGGIAWEGREVSVSPDGNMILLWDRWADMNPRIFDDTGKLMSTINAPEAEIISMAVSSGGDTAWVSKDRNSDNYKLTIRETGGEIHYAALPYRDFIPELRILWSGDSSMTALLHPDKDRFPVYRRDGTILGAGSGHRTPVSALTFTADSSRIISASYDGEIRIWETRGEY